MNSVDLLTDPHTSGRKRSATDDYIDNMDQKKVSELLKVIRRGSRMNDVMKTEANTPSCVLHIRGIPRDVTETEIIALGTPFGRVTNILHMKTNQQALLELEDEEAAVKMINYYTFVTPTIGGQPVFIQYSKYKELKVTNPSQALSSETSDSSSSGNTILHVTVEQLLYPVTVNVLHQIFSNYGPILKIVTFTRNSQFQALIQYQSAGAADAAKKILDGQNIYTGCNTLRIKYSKLTNLNVKYNNEKSRDFTKPDLPSRDDMAGMGALGGVPLGAAAGLVPLPFAATPGFPAAALLQSAAVFPQQFAGLPGIAGVSGANPIGATFSKQGSVLLVSNLDEDNIRCDDLFTLFGHYGDVHRVKILFNKKDSALIQMADGRQAQTAQQHLNGIKLYGKEIRVSKSKHDSVNMPKNEEEDRELTKDYSSSQLHRFKKPGSKNFQNIFPPVRTLHLSNIPEEVAEDEIRQLFMETGGKVINFRFFPKDRKMALIQMSTIEEATIALMKLHNTKLTESNHLRVSFAKNEM